MALTVEDGTGLTNADAYFDAAEVDSYNLLYGSQSEWDALTDDEKEQKIRFITRWVDKKFRYKSYLLNTDQSLGFPRMAYIDDDGRTVKGVPTEFKNAVIEVLLYHVKNDLSAIDERGTVVTSEKVGNSSASYRNGNPTEVAMGNIIQLFTRFVDGGASVAVVERC